MGNYLSRIAQLFGSKTNDEYVRRAAKAKQILDDEFVQEALESIEVAILDQWRTLSVSDKDKAEELKKLLWAAQQFKSVFTVAVANGEIAQEELLHQERIKNTENQAIRRVYG